MTIKEMKSEIVIHEEGKVRCFNECEEIYGRLQEICILFMKDEIKNRIEREVKNNPEITKELGLETLKTVKQKMTDSIISVEKLVPEYFKKQHINKHEVIKVEEGDTWGQKYNIPQNIKKDISSVVRKLLGLVGEILIEYKYEKVGNSAWRKDYSTNNRVEYAYRIDVSNEVEDIMKEYSAKCQEMFEHMCHINELNKQIAKQEAEDLWSQA